MNEKLRDELFQHWWKNELPVAMFDDIHPDEEPAVYRIAKAAWNKAFEVNKE